MMPHHMKALSKGGQKVNNAGKGSQVQPLGARNNIGQSGSALPGAGINNYAKASPMGQPSPAAAPVAPPSPQPAPPNTGLGSGTFPGVSG
jgi:hypothetical protein